MLDENKKIYEAYERSILRLDEKWPEGIKIQATGEYAGKTIAELKKMLKAVEGKSPFDREKHSEVMFAIRSKGGWVKGPGAVAKSKEKKKK